MLKDFPVVEGGVKQQGQNKLDRAMECIGKLSKGLVPLIDENLQPVPVSKKNIEYWPDNTTQYQTEENAGGETSFRIKKVF